MKENNTKNKIQIKRILKLSPTEQKNIIELHKELSSSGKITTPNLLKKALTTKSTFLYGAFEGKVILGMITAILTTTITGNRVRIEDFVVSEQARGKGVGSGLLKKVISEAKKLKVISIDLTSSPKRVSARAMYLKNGFTQRDTSVFRL